MRFVFASRLLGSTFWHMFPSCQAFFFSSFEAHIGCFPWQRHFPQLPSMTDKSLSAWLKKQTHSKQNKKANSKTPLKYNYQKSQTTMTNNSVLKPKCLILEISAESNRKQDPMLLKMELLPAFFCPRSRNNGKRSKGDISNSLGAPCRWENTTCVLDRWMGTDVCGWHATCFVYVFGFIVFMVSNMFSLIS